MRATRDAAGSAGLSVEDARIAYAYWANWQRLALAAHLRGIGRRPDVCSVCPRIDRRLFAASIALDLAVSERHRVTGGPHPTLLGLTDGAAVAAHAGVAWS